RLAVHTVHPVQRTCRVRALDRGLAGRAVPVVAACFPLHGAGWCHTADAGHRSVAAPPDSVPRPARSIGDGAGRGGVVVLLTRPFGRDRSRAGTGNFSETAGGGPASARAAGRRPLSSDVVVARRVRCPRCSDRAVPWSVGTAALVAGAHGRAARPRADRRDPGPRLWPRPADLCVVVCA